jgi:glutamate synthase (NADPH/NADH) small chain
LRYGIPDFKLNKHTIDRRLKILLAEGIEIKCETEVGKDIPGKELLQKYDAICLTIGAMQPRDLEVEGRELDGIHFAMDYLTQQNKVNDGAYVAYDNRITAENRHVLVIGGGDTGSDCVGTAIRQKAKSVTQIEILPKPPEQRAKDNPWPYWGKTLKTSTSHEEGCERRWSLSTLKFHGMQQRITHAEVEEVLWEKVNGSYKMVKVPGSRKMLEADLVLLAMGFVHPVHEGLLTEMEISLNGRKNIDINQSMATNVEKVFAAGDAASGASLVVNAIASGRRVAKKIDRYLSSK